MNIETIMNYLFVQRAEGLSNQALADVFDRLIWCTADNGKAICMVREKWLEGDSFEKCEIALSMNETFPYENISKMEDVFKSIISKWSYLKTKCDEIVKSRIEQDSHN